MIRKWNIALTYEPKIEPVKAGTCTQTIRTIGKKGPKKVGDLISFHGWSGRPYWSSWSWRTRYTPITEVLPFTIFNDGISFPSSLGGIDVAIWKDLDKLATLDGIIPPTGEALRDVLISKNGPIPNGGIEAQIIRWATL